MRPFQLHYDRDYGALRRTGWTIVWDGATVAEFERWLIVAVWRAWRNVREFARVVPGDAVESLRAALAEPDDAEWESEL